MLALSEKILVGQTMVHVVEWKPGIYVHAQACDALDLLSQQAKSDRFNLKIVSSFRTFETQLKIWNEKCLGHRDVLDNAGRPLDVSSLTDRELAFMILRWSALPGATRHHWGTDFDIVDANVVESGYRPRLTPAEAEAGGAFHDFNLWLSSSIHHHGFFRPYEQDLGGIAPEWWHLSYESIAREYASKINQDLVRQILANADIKLKETVMSCLPDIWERFVKLPDLPMS